LLKGGIHCQAENTIFDNQTNESPEKQEMATNIDTDVNTWKFIAESDITHVDSAVTLEFDHIRVIYRRDGACGKR
jgi:hypothetical protein